MQISRQNSNCIQIDAVSLFTQQTKLYRFGNAPLLAAFSNRPSFVNRLDRCHANRRCNHIENDAVTMQLNQNLPLTIIVSGKFDIYIICLPFGPKEDLVICVRCLQAVMFLKTASSRPE